MDAQASIYRQKAERININLKKRNMDGMYCENGEEAVEAVLKMIPDGALVGLGGSETIIETGFVDALRTRDLRLLDRYREGISKEEIDGMRRIMLNDRLLGIRVQKAERGKNLGRRAFRIDKMTGREGL